MCGKQKRSQAELLEGMEGRMYACFGEFETARLVPFQRKLLENLNDALHSQIEDAGIDPATFREIFVAECKTPWEIELPLLEDEFLDSGDMPEWMDIARTLGHYDKYGQWFNGRYDALTHQLLFNGTKVVGDVVLRHNVSPIDPEWK